MASGGRSRRAPTPGLEVSPGGGGRGERGLRLRRLLRRGRGPFGGGGLLLGLRGRRGLLGLRGRGFRGGLLPGLLDLRGRGRRGLLGPDLGLTLLEEFQEGGAAAVAQPPFVPLDDPGVAARAVLEARAD